MTAAARRRALAVGAVVIGIAAAATRPGATDETRGIPRQSRPVVVAPRRARPPLARPLRRDEALRVARRFAAAYAAWDAGQRSPRSARRLARTATPDLVTALRRDMARPTARPAQPLALVIVGNARRADGRYLVALGLRHAHGAHVATLLVTPTADGPRVARLQR